MEILSTDMPYLFLLTCLIALSSDPAGPCGPNAKVRARTIPDHLQAICNHTRSIALLLLTRLSGPVRE